MMCNFLRHVISFLLSSDVSSAHCSQTPSAYDNDIVIKIKMSLWRSYMYRILINISNLNGNYIALTRAEQLWSRNS
jgi:hypothetical protein